MSRAGHDYYSLIARAVEALHINVRETRMTLYERARRAQLSSFDPAIPEAEFRRERTALEQAIRAVEVKAAAADGERAKRDSKIVTDYAGFIAEAPTRQDCFYDASELPHPKEVIIAAGRVWRPRNVLQYLPRHAWQLGNVYRDQECLVAREQLALERRPDSFSK